MTAITRTKQVVDALLDKDTPTDQLLRVADAFVEHAGEAAIQEAFDTDIASLTNEQKAMVFLEIMLRAGKAVLTTSARNEAVAAAQADIETAISNAETDMT